MLRFSITPLVITIRQRFGTLFSNTTGNYNTATVLRRFFTIHRHINAATGENALYSNTTARSTRPTAGRRFTATHRRF